MMADLLAPQRVLDRVAGMVNRLLRADEAASAQLRDLAGRTVAVQVTRLGLKLCIAIEADGILLATRSATQADIVLEGTLTDFIAMARAHQAGAAVPAGKVRIQGDIATVRQLESALDSLSIDWEAQLSRQISRVIEGAFAFVRQSHASLERDVGEYLLEEARLMPTAHDIEQLGAEALRLDMALDRCAARITRLERKRPQ